VFVRLLLLFLLIPIVEIAVLVEVGKHIGTGPTVGIILVTGLIGAWLAKGEGLLILFSIQRSVMEGRVPTDELVEGFLVLLGGVLLLTPGLVTDMLGFLCLIPTTRGVIKRLVYRKFQQIAGSHGIHFS
jgi:UPF0716 protein FxsA